MPKTRRSQSGKLLDLLGTRLGPRNEFALAQIIEGVLTPEFTRDFDGPYNSLEVVICPEIVAIDYSGILEVIAGQPHEAFAGRLHQGWRDRERVWRRCSKAFVHVGGDQRELMKHKTDARVIPKTARPTSFVLDGLAHTPTDRDLDF